jgi:hypothetical protein
MKVKDIKVGECYRTSTYEVRNVISIEAGVVKYNSRGRRCIPRTWRERNTWRKKPIERFAAEVVKRVSWWWQPQLLPAPPPSSATRRKRSAKDPANGRRRPKPKRAKPKRSKAKAK